MQYFIIYTVLAFRRKSSARPSGKKVTCRTVAGPEEDVRRVAPAAETQPRRRWRSWSSQGCLLEVGHRPATKVSQRGVDRL